jgi:hypothetical protein
MIVFWEYPDFRDWALPAEFKKKLNINYYFFLILEFSFRLRSGTHRSGFFKRVPGASFQKNIGRRFVELN